MKRIYSMLMLAAIAVMTSLSVVAQVPRPAAPGGDVLTTGKTYTFFCYSKLAGQMIRTSWDGAIYSPGAGTSPFTVQLVAQENSDGTWSFFHDTDEGDEAVRYFMNIPSGTGNVNVKATEQCDWTIAPGQYDGFYFVMPGEGNNPMAIGYNMHMNTGNEYVVASYYGDSWYPDFYGGVLQDEYGDNVYISDDPEENRVVMADSSSCNWAFVEVDNVPAFLEKAEVFAFLNNFYDNYVSEDDPIDGFRISYNAALAIYNGGAYAPSDVDRITATLNNKLALYRALNEAMADDEVQEALPDVISAAAEAFESLSDADAVAAALDKLNKAVSDFKLGIGDVTSMGVNMSFEDLSAQGGGTTTGVQGAPAGWNVYIKGQQVTTADEVRSAGFSAWHGQNADGTGAKDGEYIFGIWNGTIPQYEISQTIEGLENGSYTITAALMVGANGSGSRRTTQRIFGNLNSTYFAAVDEYDMAELDMSEVYGFQENVETQTDTELQPISVRAYVYDGTLTFGVRTDGNIAAALRTERNGAGGDGWFKVDDFRIRKEGYIASDAMAIVQFYGSKLYDVLDDSEYRMYPTTREAALTELSNSYSTNIDSDPAVITATICFLRGSIVDVQAVNDACSLTE